jgi:hypothetical protein
MDVPTAGDYTVVVDSADLSGWVDPRVTLGEPPFNPFGPPIVGAALILGVFALIGLALGLLTARRGPAPPDTPYPPQTPEQQVSIGV